MYVCICHAITEKDLRDNSFLAHKIGTQCGKCIQSGKINDGESVTYLFANSDLEDKK